MNSDTNTKKSIAKNTITKKQGESAGKDVPSLKTPAIKVPTLPGFMARMLINPAEEDKDLIYVNTRFFAKTMEISYGVRQENGAVVEMTELEYDNHKRTRISRKREEMERNAIKGLRMKIHDRLMIVSPVDDPALSAVANNGFTGAALDLMSKSQKDFAAKYPNATDVVKFWEGRSPETLTTMEALSVSFGMKPGEWKEKLNEEIKSIQAREAVKARQAANRKEILDKKKATVQSTTLPPDLSWADAEDEKPKPGETPASGSKAPPSVKKTASDEFAIMDLESKKYLEGIKALVTKKGVSKEKLSRAKQQLIESEWSKSFPASAEELIRTFPADGPGTDSGKAPAHSSAS